MKNRTYIAIDLKSFYASVECRERKFDPLDTNLVVADESRTDKTICLAVTPSLKSYGISGRGRLFEVKQRVKEANEGRKRDAPGRMLKGSSCFFSELQNDPSLAIDFIIAPPRMAHYMEYSMRIYEIYMKYISPSDIVVYSIDEVFMDVTNYLDTYKLSARELTMKIILDVLNTTGITATAGIGSNLYLCKIAMDIVAKRLPADEKGVRIAELNEMSYRKELWSHRPITDFWRIGKGYSRKLEENGLFTMGDIARCSIENDEILYTLFGKNAELLIDHAWGWEPCTIKDIKAYKPMNKSICSGQVLLRPYTADEARLVIREMADALALDLCYKGLFTKQIVITIGYDIENITNPSIRKKYKGKVVKDSYGRSVPVHSHGTINIDHFTSSGRAIMEAVDTLYTSIVNSDLLVRRLNITANNVLDEEGFVEENNIEQLDFFTDYESLDNEKIHKKEREKKERSIQIAAMNIKKRFGKNSMLKLMNFEEGATSIDRNEQIGGHKA